MDTERPEEMEVVSIELSSSGPLKSYFWRKMTTTKTNYSKNLKEQRSFSKKQVSKVLSMKIFNNCLFKRLNL